MRHLAVATGIFLCLILTSCSPARPSSEVSEVSLTSSDSTLFSFVFTGCNRVNRHDHTHPSTANYLVLQRIYQDISALEPAPELFFFLGDMVYGEGDTGKLDRELKAWKALYEDTSYSGISQSGIELVAVPGNHEMLTYKDHAEYPLEGSINVWMKYMEPYLPADRVTVADDSLVNRSTFSFVRHNTAFIVMNTDSYNNNPPPNGTEGIIPEDWIVKQAKAYQADSTIEHIFILGHKPCYVGGHLETGHEGLPEGPDLWPKIQQAQVEAMLSAHQHYYDRMQPGDSATYQVIAGNGGSAEYEDTAPAFFGYTMISVMSDGRLVLKSMGFDPGSPYTAPPSPEPTTVRDSTVLTWSANGNPYSRSR